MDGSIRFVAVLILGLVLATTGAHASPSRLSQAQEKFQSGLVHFNLQEYDAAIADFEAGYRLKPNPTFLYNLAQAHRLAGHGDRAIHFYRAYLHAQPDSPDRAEVEKRIQALMSAPPAPTPTGEPPAAPVPTVAPAAAPVSTAGPATAAAPAPPPPAQVTVDRSLAPPSASAQASASDRPPARRPLYKKWWLWTVVGVVVAGGVAAGVAVGLSANGGSHFHSSIPDLGPGAHGGGLSLVRF